MENLQSVDLIQGLPAFFWLDGQATSSIHGALDKAFDQAKNPERQYILKVSGFYGESTYVKYRSKLKKESSAWIDSFRGLPLLFRVSRTNSLIEDEQQADNLSLDLAKKYDISKLFRLQKLDCALYAPFSP